MIKFDAVIKKHENIDGAYIEIPFDVEEAFGSKIVKVKATFDNFLYRGSIVRMGDCYLIGITKEIRQKINKTFDDIIKVIIEKDEDERKVVIPDYFQQELDKNKKANDFFNLLSYTNKKEYINWLDDAKKEETKKVRLKKAIELLKETKKLK